MGKKVDVFVHDKDGNGLSGQKVKYYGGDVVYTNSDGIASLILTGDGSTEVYVNGKKVWKGFKSSVPGTLTYKK